MSKKEENVIDLNQILKNIISFKDVNFYLTNEQNTKIGEFKLLLLEKVNSEHELQNNVHLISDLISKDTLLENQLIFNSNTDLLNYQSSCLLMVFLIAYNEWKNNCIIGYNERLMNILFEKLKDLISCNIDQWVLQKTTFNENHFIFYKGDILNFVLSKKLFHNNHFLLMKIFSLADSNQYIENTL